MPPPASNVYTLHVKYMLCVLQSGLLGLAGNADLRSVVAAADGGDDQARLAIEVG